MAYRKQILHNEEFYFEEDFKLTHENRAFRYGDFFFETMFSVNGEIKNFNLHLSRIRNAAKTFQYILPEKFTVNTKILSDEIKKLLNKNKIFKGAVIRLNIFRNQGGLYTPTDNNASYFIESRPYENDKYVINENGLTVDFYPNHKKNINAFSAYKTGNSILFILAGKYATENKLDECIILNDKGHVCESVSSNIFIYKDDVLMTPSLSSGCIDGVMRKKIIEIAKNESVKVTESEKLTEEHLIDSGEIFLTNAVSGVKYVKAFKNRRYYNRISKFFIEKLNS